MLFQGPFWVPFVCPQYSSHAFRHLDTPSQSPSLTCPVTIPSHPTLLPTSSTPRNTPHRLQLFQPHPPASNTDHPHLYQLQIQLCTHNTHLTAPDADLPPRPHAYHHACSSCSPHRLRQVKEPPHSRALTPGLHQAQPQSNPHPPQSSPSLDHMQSRTELRTHDELSEDSDGEVSVDSAEFVRSFTS